jgi:hypothetical protein
MTVQDYCIRPWTHGAVTALSGAVFMTVQDYCIRPWTHGAVTALSRGCHEAVLMPVQDYCIRHIPVVLSQHCHGAVTRLSS